MIDNKNVKVLMVVLLALNTLLSLSLVFRQSPESIEIMKVWWQDNYNIMKEIFGSEQFKSQQKAGLESSLNQMKWQTTGANDVANTDTANANTQPVVTDTPKSDKPEVWLFIMSYCPYWLQAQKWILDVMKRFNNVADVKIKFVHYIMHWVKEAQENVRQYCIQSEQTEKFTQYLECFLKAWETDKCLADTNINTSKLDTCYADTYKKYDIEKNIAEWGQYPPFGVDAEESKTAWVQWSPTLVINWKIVETGRSANDYKEAICNAFNNKPSVCNEDFVKVAYDPQFGFTSNWGTVAGWCGQ